MRGGVTIGNNVTLSREVIVLTTSLKTNDYLNECVKQYRDHEKKAVFIGDGTWCATRAIICPGAYIPEKCIIASGAVVVGTLDEPGCLYGGVPARKIKKLT